MIRRVVVDQITNEAMQIKDMNEGTVKEEGFGSDECNFWDNSSVKVIKRHKKTGCRHPVHYFHFTGSLIW